MATDANLEVMISANTADLKTGMESAATSVGEAGAAMAAEAEETAAVMTSAFERIKIAAGKIGDGVKGAAGVVGDQMSHMSHEAHEHGEKIEHSMDSIGKKMKLLQEILVVGAIGEAMHELMEKTAEYGDSVEKATAKTGLSGEKFQELAYAANMADIGIEQLGAITGILSRNMQMAQNEASPVAKAFEAIGIKAGDVKNMKVDEVLLKMAEAFEGTEDGAAKTAVAMTILGRGGAAMVPLLDKGKQGIEELMGKSKSLGLVLQEDTIKKMAELDDQMKEVHAVHESMAVQIGSELIPAYMGLSKAFESNLAEGGSFKTFMSGLGTVLTDVAWAGSFVGEAFQMVGSHIAATAASAAAAAQGNFREAALVFMAEGEDIMKLHQSYVKFREDLTHPVVIPKAEHEGEDEKEKKKINFDPSAAKAKTKSLEMELAELKAHYQEEQREQGSFVEFSTQQELAFWQSKLSTVAKGSDDEKAIRLKIAEDKLTIDKKAFDAEIAGLKTQMEDYKNSGAERVVIAEQVAAKEKAAYGASSKEYAEAQKEVVAAKAQAAAQVREIEASIQKSVMDNTLAQIAAEEALSNMRLSVSLETEQQAFDLEKQFADRRYALEVQELNRAKALLDPKRDPVQVAKVNAQLEALETKHSAAINKIQMKEQASNLKEWKKLSDGMQSSMQSAFKGILTGTTSLSGAVKSLFSSIGDQVANVAAQMAADWIMNQVKIRLASMETTLAQLNNSAVAAAGAAYDAIVGIPYVGPFLAPAAAAVAYAGVMAFGSMASAEGGYDIPSGVNPITQLHQNEMVLPAAQANVIRNLASDGGAGSGAQGINLHFHGTPMPGGFFMMNQKDMVKSIQQAQRSRRL